MNAVLIIFVFLFIAAGISIGVYFAFFNKKSCPNDCSKHGDCDHKTGLCDCSDGYSGDDCGTKDEPYIEVFCATPLSVIGENDIPNMLFVADKTSVGDLRIRMVYSTLSDKSIIESAKNAVKNKTLGKDVDPESGASWMDNIPDNILLYKKVAPNKFSVKEGTDKFLVVKKDGIYAEGKDAPTAIMFKKCF